MIARIGFMVVGSKLTQFKTFFFDQKLKCVECFFSGFVIHPSVLFEQELRTHEAVLFRF